VTHAAVPGRTERLLRCGLWALGYGFRAGCPAATWAITATAVWLATALGPAGLDPRSLPAVALLPVGSLFRLGESGPLVAELGGVWRLLATAALAVPAAFTALGVRHQLRQPHPG
jgi:hypothetical protein